MIDSELAAEIPGLDHSDVNKATGICIGYAPEVKHKTFTGSIRNLRYEECKILTTNHEMKFKDLYNDITNHRNENLA